MNEENKQSEKSITLFSFFGSLVAAWFGVSTKEKRERDFENGKFSHFIIGGIIFAILFVLMVVGIVNIVLSSVGA